MGRRKGEKPIVRIVWAYDDAHPVARSIASGTPWFAAWMHQEATPYVRLRALTKIPIDRLIELDGGSGVTAAEIESLATAWFVTPADLTSSIPTDLRL